MAFYLVLIFLLLSQLVHLESPQYEDDPYHVISPPFQARIVNGTEAEEGRWPFMASLEMIMVPGYDYDHACSGTILNDDTILTNYWCLIHDVDKATETRVVIGLLNISNSDPKYVYNVTKFILGTNDVGVIKLARKIDFSEANVSKICLPSPDDEPVVDECMALGWGFIGPFIPFHNDSKESAIFPDERFTRTLHQVDFPIRSVDECKDDLVYDDKITYCAGYSDGHKSIGDGGVPLVCPSKSEPNVFLQYGISNYAKVNFVAHVFFVKTATTKQLDWIRQQAEA